MTQKLFFLAIVLIATQACRRQSRHQVIDASSTELSEVLRYLESLESEYPNDHAIFYQKAKTFIDIGDFRRAKIEINRALKLKPLEPEYNALNGFALCGLKQYEEAIEVLTLAEAGGQQSPKTYKTLSEAYLRLGQPMKAKSAVARLLTISENESNLTIAANIHRDLEDTDAAIDYYRRAIALNQDSDNEAFKKLTSLYMDENKTVLAENLINSAIKRDSTATYFLKYKAKLLKERKSLDTAKIIYQKLFENNPDDINILNEFADLEFEREVYSSALDLVSRSLAKDSLQPAVLLLSARSFDKTRNYDSAMLNYNALIKLDSTNEIAQNEIQVLKRKVAYLWRLKREREELEKSRNNLPPSVTKKTIE